MEGSIPTQKKLQFTCPNCGAYSVNERTFFRTPGNKLTVRARKALERKDVIGLQIRFRPHCPRCVEEGKATGDLMPIRTKKKGGS